MEIKFKERSGRKWQGYSTPTAVRSGLVHCGVRKNSPPVTEIAEFKLLVLKRILGGRKRGFLGLGVKRHLPIKLPSVSA